MNLYNPILITLSMRITASQLIFFLVALMNTHAFAGDVKSPTAQVVMLTHLAVILPESEYSRDYWECELWTPTLEQTAAAEKAIILRLNELAKLGERINGEKIDLNAKYIIQYYGIVLKKRKWIGCSIININTFVELARHSGDPLADVAGTIESVFTIPYKEDDSDNWFDAYYDPSSNELSETMGFLTTKPTYKPCNKDGAVKNCTRAYNRQAKRKVGFGLNRGTPITAAESRPGFSDFPKQ